MINYDGLYNKDYFSDKLKDENHFSDKKLHFKIIENATILPHKGLPDSLGFGGIVDSNGNFIEESFIHPSKDRAYTPHEELIFITEPVIYFGMLVNIWGHCLTDNIKRLWFFFSELYDKEFKKVPILYNRMWYGIVPNFARLLQVMGIDPNLLHPIVKPLKCQFVILPDESIFSAQMGGGTGLFYTAEYVDTIERARQFAQKNFSTLPNKKFYFFHGRNQIGEERIAGYLETKGYEIIHPLKLSIDEQLNILANCESFVSQVGSIAHNTLFVKDGTECVFIPRTSDGATNNYQAAINQMRNLNATYIDSTLTIFGGLGPYCYIVSENLRKHFNDDVTEKYTDEDFETFLVYLKYAKSRGLSENPSEIAYLRNVLPEFMEQLKKRDDLMKKIGVFFK